MNQLISEKITIYHGSEHIIDKPAYGIGKKYNDYGLGFYTTFDKQLAGEWAVLMTQKSGYINEYELDIFDLKILDLDSIPMINMIALLLEYRGGSFDSVQVKRKKKLLKKYLIDISSYDIIKGWRADDSFFDYASQFLNVSLSLEKFKEAMYLGNLIEQICIKSKKAFDNLKFIGNLRAPAQKYLSNALSRDKNARNNFKSLKDKDKDEGTLILNLIGEMGWPATLDKINEVVLKNNSPI